ncbi:MAG: ABC transporter permease subunit [Pirellulaceae bacterium]
MPDRFALSEKSRIGLAIAAGLLTALVLVWSGGTLQVLWNSAILAAGAAAIALPIGTLLAVLLTRFRLPGRRLAAASLGVLLFLPLYVQLSGWDAASGKLGWFTLAFGSGPRPWLEGMPGAIFVHGVAAAPWVALIVGLGLREVDSRQEEAALLDAGPLAVLWSVTLPQCWSFLVAATLWTAVSTASEMTVTNIYLIAPEDMTYTEQFYMNFSLSSDATRATLGVLPALAGLALTIGATFWLLAKLTSRRVLAGASRGIVFPTGMSSIPLTALLWGGVLVLLGVPLASLLVKAGFEVALIDGVRHRGWSAAKAWEVIRQTPWLFRYEFGWTAAIAMPAATLAIAVAIGLAWPVRRDMWRVVPTLLASVVCLAIPGPLVGVAAIYVFNGRWSGPLADLYHETLVPSILTTTIHAFPLAALIVWHSFASLRDEELAAATLDGAGPGQTLWRIALPQRWPAIAGAWLAAFAIAAGDLAWSLLVLPPGVDTLPRRVFGLVHAGVEEQVAGICLVVVAVYIVLAGLVLSLLGRRSYTSS